MLNPIELQILMRLGEGLTQAQIGAELGIEQPAAVSRGPRHRPRGHRCAAATAGGR
jgi:hypothetical protein